MADTLRIKRRSTGNPGAPASLAYAELAFNEVDNILYYGRGNNAGQAVTIIPIAGPGFVPPATPPGGSNTQVQFNDGGAFGGDAGLTYDKNTDTLTAGDIKVAQWNGVSAPVELKMQSTGGTWGTSILRIKNETGVNGAMFETVPNPGAELVDFVFKVGTITQQNIRLEARPASLISGNSWEFQFGSGIPPQYVVGNQYAKLYLLTVKSDGTLNISIGGQTTFQYDPNTNNGTFTLGAKPPHGQLLQFCARSDITGSARFFGAAGYSFDARISVPSDPTSDLELATKRYVDSKTSGGGASIVVSDTPPASPTDNMLWFESDTGALWLRYNDTTSTQWITISVPPGPITGFLPLTGGTISGNLTISNNLLVQNYMEIGGGQSDGNFIFLGEARISPAGGNSVLRLRKSASGSGNYLIGETGLNTRWQVVLGDPTAETGSNNVGSDFVINSFNDAGNFVNTPFKINRSTSTVTITAVGANWTVLNLQKSGSGVSSMVYGYTGTTARWGIALGDQIAESGSNAGSNFSIQRFNDAGTYIDSPLNINRATGATTLSSWLMMQSANPQIYLNKTGSGNYNAIIGQTNNSNRWFMFLGLDDSESGGNAGSNFSLRRYSDAGAYLGEPLFIARSNGQAYFSTPGGVATATFTGTGAGAFIRVTTSGGTVPRSWDYVAQSTNGSWLLYDATAPRVCMEVTTSGACWNPSGTWAAMSDISTKRDIQPYTRGLTDLTNLVPVMFKYNGTGGTIDDDQQMYGLVAQEAEQHVPEVVLTRDDELKGVDSGRLMFAVLNALREIDQRLRNLESK